MINDNVHTSLCIELLYGGLMEKRPRKQLAANNWTTALSNIVKGNTKRCISIITGSTDLQVKSVSPKHNSRHSCLVCTT